MYLSRVEIDYDNHRKIKDLTHLGAYHNWVEQSFPKEIANGVRNRHLWRIDKFGGHDYLIVLSADKPDLDKLAEYGIAHTAQTKEYGSFIDRIQNGEVLQFRLTANPTHKYDGHHIAESTLDGQREWLKKRAAMYGFILEPNGYDVISHNWPVLYHNGRPTKLNRVTYEGILKVTDQQTFKRMLIDGLGREKAYGMGLMTVIPYLAHA